MWSMPISDEDRQRIDYLLTTAKARLMEDTTKTFSGAAIEGTQILGQADAMIARLVDLDPVAFVDYVQRLQAIWAGYIRASSAFGLGAGTVGFEALSYSGG